MSKIQSEYSGRDELAEQYRAQQERRNEIRDQNEQELDSLKQNYAEQKATLSDRFEKSIQEDRIKHYENLRNQKTQFNREQMRLESAGRQAIQQKTQGLTQAEIQTQREGESKVNEIKQKYAAAEAYERNKTLAAQEEIRTHHRKNADTILKDSSQRIEDLREEKTKTLSKAQTEHATALQQIQGHYDGLRQNTHEQYAASLKNLYQNANQDLSQKKQYLTQMIGNYQERAQDPFYRMSRYDSDLLDVGDSYVLRVKIPNYERGQFRVQVAGQEIQLMGVRTNQEKAEIEPGRWVTTHTNQTVSERYPLDSPVDGRAMTVRDDGDWLEYRLPKYSKEHRFADANSGRKYETQDLALVREIEFPKSLPRPTIAKKPV
jgi:hypothetical protein